MDYERAPVVTSGDAVSAAFDLATDEGLTMLWGRRAALEALERQGGPQLTPEQANEKYPGMEVPFREPVSGYVAQHLYDRQRERQALQQKASAGPQDTWSQAKLMGAGLLAHMMDPAEFGAGAVIGWGVGGLLSSGAMGAKAAALSQAVSKGRNISMLNRVGINTVEAGVGNLAQNIGQEVLLGEVAEDSHQYYDDNEAISSIMYSTIFGTALGVGVKEGSFRLNKMMRIAKETSPEADLLFTRVTQGQLENDMLPNINPIIAALAQETAVGGDTHVPGRTGPYFGAVLNGEHRPVADDLGLGTSLTQDPAKAHATATRALSDSRGVVVEYNPQDLNILDLNGPIPENLKAAFEAPMKKMGMDIENLTGKDVIEMMKHGLDDAISPEDFAALKQSLSEAGYNAVATDGSSRLGHGHPSHNHIEVFNTENLKEARIHQADPSMRIEPSAKLKQEALSWNKALSFDEDSWRRAEQEIADNPLPASIEAERELIVKDVLDDLKEQEKFGALDADDVKALEEIRQMDAEKAVVDRLLVALKACVNG